MKPDRPVARKSDYIIEVCPSALAAEIVRAHHYSRSTSHRAFSVCAKLRETGEIRAAVQFLPPLPPAARLISRVAAERGLDVPPARVVTLTRLVVAPGEPQNVASMLVGAALRQLRRDGRYDAVVTFADMSEGHTGQVYRALNAEYLGVSKPEPYWVSVGADGREARVSRKATVSRTTAQMRALGLERRVSEGKHRFVWWLK